MSRCGLLIIILTEHTYEPRRILLRRPHRVIVQCCILEGPNNPWSGKSHNHGLSPKHPQTHHIPLDALLLKHPTLSMAKNFKWKIGKLLTCEVRKSESQKENCGKQYIAHWFKGSYRTLLSWKLSIIIRIAPSFQHISAILCSLTGYVAGHLEPL